MSLPAFFDQPTADWFLRLSDDCQRMAAEIDQSGTAHPLAWHVHGQLVSIANKAFDIQACILHAQQPTDKEQDMNSQIREADISEMSVIYKLPEMCDELNSLLGHLVDETDVSPINVHLQNAINCVRAAIDNINVAEGQMRTYSQTRADRPMIEAISKAIHKAFDNERNVGPANGMLQDIAASGDVILAAIRNAGYVISPEPPF